MSCKWEAIKIWVVQRLRSSDVNLAKVAADANVNYWWLHALRQGITQEPGWGKLGRVYEALGGKPPRIPQHNVADRRSIPLDAPVGRETEE